MLDFHKGFMFFQSFINTFLKTKFIVRTLLNNEKNREKLIAIAKQTGVRPEDLPKQVLDKAQKALDMLQKIGKPTKEGLLKIVKMLLPHVKSVFKSKVERKMGGSGLGLAGAGSDFDSKVLSAVSKAL